VCGGGGRPVSEKAREDEGSLTFAGELQLGVTATPSCRSNIADHPRPMLPKRFPDDVRELSSPSRPGLL
jgi:hypothetical protein